jgi:CO/xanthine dehydrogenase FAD-binding subunit
MVSGQRPSRQLSDEVATAVAVELQPDADMHASAEYRQEVGGVVARRALEAALGQARGREDR